MKQVPKQNWETDTADGTASLSHSDVEGAFCSVEPGGDDGDRRKHQESCSNACTQTETQDELIDACCGAASKQASKDEDGADQEEVGGAKRIIEGTHQQAEEEGDKHVDGEDPGDGRDGILGQLVDLDVRLDGPDCIHDPEKRET